MRFFDWLKAKRRPKICDDVVWLTHRAKLAGITADVTGLLTNDENLAAILLVGHFPDTCGALQSLVDNQGWDALHVVATAAEILVEQGIPVTELDQSRTFHIIIAERHPLLSHDTALVEVAKDCPCSCRLVHHVSLEDPVLTMFASDWVQGILERLGTSETEPINSSLVTRSIRAAQQKIEGRTSSDVPAISAEKWFERNCPIFWEQRGGGTSN